MRQTPLRTAVLALAFLTFLVSAPRATAHDFGPLSINLYGRLEVDANQVRLRWVLDMAEVPADAIIKLIDADSDGSVSDAEKAVYLETWISSLLQEIHLTVGGVELQKGVTAAKLDLPTGENGARYVRVELDLAMDLPAAPDNAELGATYRDLNYKDFIGWREVVVTAGEGVQIVRSTVPAEDRTDELKTYPPDLWVAAPNSDADFSIRVGSASPGRTPKAAAPGASEQSGATDDVIAGGVLVLVLVVVVGAVLSVLATGGTARRARRARR